MNKTIFFYISVIGLLLFYPFTASAIFINGRPIYLQEGIKSKEWSWRPPYVKKVKLREVLKDLEPEVDKINLKLDQLSKRLNEQLFPDSQDECHPGFYCFKDGIFTNLAQLNEQPREEMETISFRKSDCKKMLQSFSNWLERALNNNTNWTESDKIEIRKELLNQYYLSYFKAYKSIFDPNSVLYDLSYPEETSLRQMLFLWYELYLNRTQSMDIAENKDKDNKISQQAEVRPLIYALSNVYAPYTGLIDRFTSPNKDESGDKSIFLRWLNKVTTFFGPTNEFRSLDNFLGFTATNLVMYKIPNDKHDYIRNWCWGMEEIQNSKTKTFRLKGKIETDIKDTGLLNFIIDQIEKTWSNKIDENISLEIDLEPSIINEIPTGKTNMGLTLSSDWSHVDHRNSCDVLYISKFDDDYISAHELGHVLGFDHGNLEYIKLKPEPEVISINLLKPNIMLFEPPYSVLPSQYEQIIAELSNWNNVKFKNELEKYRKIIEDTWE
jgi:hypothetical protein